MIKPEQIPDEVRLALKETLFSGPAHDIYATALAAALNAWPGMHHYEPNAEPYYGKHLILPLTQETHND